MYRTVPEEEEEGGCRWKLSRSNKRCPPTYCTKAAGGKEASLCLYFAAFCLRPSTGVSVWLYVVLAARSMLFKVDSTYTRKFSLCRLP
jgi:hypothetical protein